jgi:hypothetical protein
MRSPAAIVLRSARVFLGYSAAEMVRKRQTKSGSQFSRWPHPGDHPTVKAEQWKRAAYGSMALSVCRSTLKRSCARL